MTWEEIFVSLDEALNTEAPLDILGDMLGGPLTHLGTFSDGLGQDRYLNYIGGLEWYISSCEKSIFIQFKIKRNVHIVRAKALWNFPALQGMIRTPVLYGSSSERLKFNGTPDAWFNDLRILQTLISKAFFHPRCAEFLYPVLTDSLTHPF